MAEEKDYDPGLTKELNDKMQDLLGRLETMPEAEAVRTGFLKRLYQIRKDLLDVKLVSQTNAEELDEAAQIEVQAAQAQARNVLKRDVKSLTMKFNDFREETDAFAAKVVAVRQDEFKKMIRDLDNLMALYPDADATQPIHQRLKAVRDRILTGGNVDDFGAGNGLAKDAHDVGFDTRAIAVLDEARDRYQEVKALADEFQKQQAQRMQMVGAK